jgi:probable rRNA maturation factor
MQKVLFFSADRKFNFNKKKKLKQFIEKLFATEKKSLESITYVFCSDEYLLEINKKFLQHNYYTDIITFDLSNSNQIIGEVYVSIDRIKENIKSLRTTIDSESLRVIFHGALHLCGYKDKTKKDISIMRAKEDFYLSNFIKFTY